MSTIAESIAPAKRFRRVQSGLLGYVVAAVVIVLMTVALEYVVQAHIIANVAMLYLLAVYGTAILFGRGPGLLAAMLAYGAVDWYFITPHYMFIAKDPDDWIALGGFMVTAIVTGQFTAVIRAREAEASQRERETAALADASWTVASHLDSRTALAELLRRLLRIIGAETAVIVAAGPEGLTQVVARSAVPGAHAASQPDPLRVERVLQDGTPEGWPLPEAPPPTLNGTGWSSYLPVRMEQQVLGVLCLQWQAGFFPDAVPRRVVESLTNHAALVLQRERLMHVEAQAQALREADRLKTALLQMVSHDFRSPLTSIKAGLSGLRREDATTLPGEEELLQAMDLETDRLIRMVDNVLALSELEAGACRPQRETVSVAELVGAALDTFGDDENRRIRLEFDSALSVAWLDEVQMVQVLHNLLENALKYSPPDSDIQLSALRRGDRLIFEVSDHGPGLPHGEEESIFDRFYRGRGLKESAVRGLGLGLSLSRGLVEAHDGALTARNRADGGTTFTVSLPLQPREEHRREEPVRAYSGS